MISNKKKVVLDLVKMHKSPKKISSINDNNFFSLVNKLYCAKENKTGKIKLAEVCPIVPVDRNWSLASENKVSQRKYCKLNGLLINVKKVVRTIVAIKINMKFFSSKLIISLTLK